MRLFSRNRAFKEVDGYAIMAERRSHDGDFIYEVHTDYDLAWDRAKALNERADRESSSYFHRVTGVKVYVKE